MDRPLRCRGELVYVTGDRTQDLSSLSFPASVPTLDPWSSSRRHILRLALPWRCRDAPRSEARRAAALLRVGRHGSHRPRTLTACSALFSLTAPRCVCRRWGGPELTEAFTVFPRAVAEVVPEHLRPTKHKRIQGSEPVLRALLEEAGACDIRISLPTQRMLTVANAQAFYDRFAQGTPTYQHMLARLDAATLQRLHAKIVDPLRARFGDGAVSLPASAFLCAANKPDHAITT
jgi:hypothetical protein